MHLHCLKATNQVMSLQHWKNNTHTDRQIHTHTHGGPFFLHRVNHDGYTHTHTEPFCAQSTMAVISGRNTNNKNKTVRVCVRAWLRSWVRACVRGCVCVCACLLRIVSTNKILPFINTSVITVIKDETDTWAVTEKWLPCVPCWHRTLRSHIEKPQALWLHTQPWNAEEA